MAKAVATNPLIVPPKWKRDLAEAPQPTLQPTQRPPDPVDPKKKKEMTQSLAVRG